MKIKPKTMQDGDKMMLFIFCWRGFKSRIFVGRGAKFEKNSLQIQISASSESIDFM
jgi:hypothetical protein